MAARHEGQLPLELPHIIVSRGTSCIRPLRETMPLRQENGADGWTERFPRPTVLPTSEEIPFFTSPHEFSFVDQASGSKDNTPHKLPDHLMKRLKGFERNIVVVYGDIDGKLRPLERKIHNLNQRVQKIKEMNHQAGVKGKVNKLKAYEVLLDYYADMCTNITDVNNFAHYLVTLRVITPQDEKELRETKPESLQVRKLLDRIVGPVESGRPEVFYNLLNVMEVYGLQPTHLLAIDIKRCLGYDKDRFQGDYQLMQFKQRLSELEKIEHDEKNKIEHSSLRDKLEEINHSVKHLLEGTRYEAIHDYTATADDEVSFNKGDIILFPSFSKDEGWMEGYVKRSGKQGLFPLNYVQKLF